MIYMAISFWEIRKSTKNERKFYVTRELLTEVRKHKVSRILIVYITYIYNIYVYTVLLKTAFGDTKLHISLNYLK